MQTQIAPLAVRAAEEELNPLLPHPIEIDLVARRVRTCSSSP